VNRKTPLGALVPIVMALLYGVSPLDIIPDVLPLIGLVDDALIVPMLLLLGFMQLRKSREMKKQPIVVSNKR
jgi:uncharacterized membrane protein YkvA (DUF1232 family)